ncbi:hypothetical protein NDU88_001370 [Pleurodeles waltl]|uniref:Uncharacterized protein n=1 Tax=Pleurodeles waltl TaxID=8319 RepID=A0AAV7NAK1_PLEWA|nr:hypothetical protein NDU88_001370 [Pleurodeles waltl]
MTLPTVRLALRSEHRSRQARTRVKLAVDASEQPKIIRRKEAEGCCEVESAAACFGPDSSAALRRAPVGTGRRRHCPRESFHHHGLRSGTGEEQYAGTAGAWLRACLQACGLRDS